MKSIYKKLSNEVKSIIRYTIYQNIDAEEINYTRHKLSNPISLLVIDLTGKTVNQIKGQYEFN
jgi:hypothetical protein